MAINYSSLLKLPKPDAGTAAWATYMHRLADIADGLAGKVVTVTKVTGATTLPDLDGTADNGKAPIIRSTMTLTGAVTVNVPARNRLILAENFTGGTGTWKIQTSGGNGVIVPKNRRMWLRSTTTGVIPVSRTDGRSTATEIGVGVITSTHLAANTVTTAKIVNGSVTLPKLAGGGSYGRIIYTATSAGFPFTTLARGTANQVLAMSTSVNTIPSWKTPVFRTRATSTGITFANNSTITYTHGIAGITNKYDIFARIWLECISADANYSVGDCVLLVDSNSTSGPLTIVVDSLTAVKLLTDDSHIVRDKSSAVSATLTASRWVCRFAVYAH